MCGVWMHGVIGGGASYIRWKRYLQSPRPPLSHDPPSPVLIGRIPQLDLCSGVCHRDMDNPEIEHAASTPRGGIPSTPPGAKIVAIAIADEPPPAPARSDMYCSQYHLVACRDSNHPIFSLQHSFVSDVATEMSSTEGQFA